MRDRFTLNQVRRVAVLALFVGLVAVPISSSNAQSGSKSADSSSAGMGSTASKTKPALNGYCPVCIINMKKWIAGTPEFQSTYDGKTYFFPGLGQKTEFDSHPAKYAPVLSGDCVVAYKSMGKRIAGNIGHAAFHEERLFLFVNQEAQKSFLADPDSYANIDVALGGKCSVCQVEMQKTIDGNAEFAVMHRGMRYYFPGVEQRDMFLANPSRYEVPFVAADPPQGSHQKGSGSKSGGRGSSRK